MALATICPHCRTTFRVASDQLKLRGGIVRCGACNEVFDGNAALVDFETAQAAAKPAEEQRLDQAPPLPEPAAPVADAAVPIEPEPEIGGLPVLHSVVEAEPATPAQEPIYVIDFDTTIDAAADSSADPAATHELLTTPAAPALPAGAFEVEEHLVALPPPDAEDPVVDPAADPASDPFADPFQTPPAGTRSVPPPPPRPSTAAADSLAPLLTRASAAAEDRMPAASPAAGPATVLRAGQTKTARRGAAAASRKAVPAHAPAPPKPPPLVEEIIEDEPEFVRSSRLREASGANRRKLMMVGVAVLTLLLLAQGVWSFRNSMAARYPAMRPVLAGACTLLGCKVGLPAQIDALAVEAGELQTLDATTFSLTTLLRNQGELVQSWPHLELALTDANDKTLVRRVIAPADYLPAGAAAGMSAKGFAGRSEQPIKLFFQLDGIKASGYHLAIFYP